EARRTVAERGTRPDVLPRRKVDRLRLVERRGGRTRLEGPGERSRIHAGQADEGRRPLREPRLVAEGRQDRAPARLGPRVPRPPAGGGGVLPGLPPPRR